MCFAYFNLVILFQSLNFPPTMSLHCIPRLYAILHGAHLNIGFQTAYFVVKPLGMVLGNSDFLFFEILIYKSHFIGKLWKCSAYIGSPPQPPPCRSIHLPKGYDLKNCPLAPVRPSFGSDLHMPPSFVSADCSGNSFLRLPNTLPQVSHKPLLLCFC